MGAQRFMGGPLVAGEGVAVLCRCAQRGNEKVNLDCSSAAWYLETWNLIMTCSTDGFHLARSLCRDRHPMAGWTMRSGTYLALDCSSAAWYLEASHLINYDM